MPADPAAPLSFLPYHPICHRSPDRTYTLDDITASELRILTQFCYRHKPAGCGPLPPDATPKLLPLLRLAHRYQMDHLLQSLLLRVGSSLRLDDSIFAVCAVAIELEIASLIEQVRWR